MPCTFVEAPTEYPDGQVVTTIDVPGFSDLAEKNGECICWLRNEGLRLIDDNLLLLDLQEALEFIGDNTPDGEIARRSTADIVAYAKSLGWRKDQP